MADFDYPQLWSAEILRLRKAQEAVTTVMRAFQIVIENGTMMTCDSAPGVKPRHWNYCLHCKEYENQVNYQVDKSFQGIRAIFLVRICLTDFTQTLLYLDENEISAIYI